MIILIMTMVNKILEERVLELAVVTPFSSDSIKKM